MCPKNTEAPNITRLIGFHGVDVFSCMWRHENHIRFFSPYEGRNVSI